MQHDGLLIIYSSTLSAFVAQVLKIFWYRKHGRPVNFRVLVETGGMPSSHSAAMSALATGAGLVSGFRSVDFAVALGLALIVMYDAAGVRLAAGRMATVLNKMTEDFYSNHPTQVPKRLKELLGHTPYEVLAGGLLGIAIALTFYMQFG